jgi:hypothetical protein
LAEVPSAAETQYKKRYGGEPEGKAFVRNDPGDRTGQNGGFAQRLFIEHLRLRVARGIDSQGVKR